MTNNWTPPSALTRSRPRNVGPTFLGRFIMAIAAFSFAASWASGIAMHIADVHLAARMDSLRAHGVDGNALISRRWMSGGRNSRPYLEYTFAVNGRSVQGEVSVSQALYDSYQLGDTVPIRYLPADPAINHPSGWEERPYGLWVELLVSALCLGLCGMIVRILRVQRRLLADGIPAEGLVVKSWRMKGDWSVRYTFRGPGDAELRGRGRSDQSFEPGTSIPILYDPNRPKRSAIYPLSLYRLTEA